MTATLAIHTEFEEIGRRYPTTDKITQHGYQRTYPFFLAPLRAQSRVFMVEIGVDRRGSMGFWCDYFPQLHYWGVDIKAGQPMEQVRPDVYILRGDQSDCGFLADLHKQIGHQVDFIIDDGSHHPTHQAMTFDHLFPQLLSDGGIYIIEDIETSYWKKQSLFGNPLNFGVGHPRSIVEIFKAIADCCNSEFTGGELLTPAAPISHAAQLLIESITFTQNALIIVKKNHAAFSSYYNRRYRFTPFTGTWNAPGAVTLLAEGQRKGRGYLELVGYHRPMKL